jgi:hypothetical protein
MIVLTPFDRRPAELSRTMATPKATKALITRLLNAGLTPRSYSGRGMFGRECVGVSLDRGQELTVNAGTASWDQLGMGRIAYWPRHEWPKGQVYAHENAEGEE